jgi:hypothetical protein
MSYSLSNAEAACGIYKSTVLRSIKSGRLTATKDALGQWRIEPAELHRVYPPVQSNDADSNGTRHGATAEVATATAALIVARDRAELAEQRLADFKVMFEDMRQDRDHWRVHAGRLALADARARHGGDALPVCRICRSRNQISGIDSRMVAFTRSQLRTVRAAADRVPAEKRGTFVDRVVARLQRQRGFTDADLDDAVRAALTGLVQSAP